MLLHPQLQWRINELAPAEFESDLAKVFAPELARISPPPEGNLPDSRPQPVLNLRADRATLGEPISGFNETRIVFVGAGPAAIIPAAYLALRGVHSEHMTFVDPRDRYGGIWNEPWVQFAGFNNYEDIAFNNRHRLEVGDRSGKRKLNWLCGIVNEYLLGATLLAETVASISPHEKLHSWQLGMANGGHIEADNVIIATGAIIPREIDRSRVCTNFNNFSSPSRVGDGFKVERFQRVLSQEELESGKSIVILGIGSSEAAMLHQIHKYEDVHGRKVDYTVLTDLPLEAIKHPEDSFNGKPPVFRNSDEVFSTGYSGAIARDRESYERAREAGKIVTDVTDAHYDTTTRSLVVKTSNPDNRTQKYDQPLTFALVGYEPDASLFRQLGAVSPNGQPLLRRSDGAVHVPGRGYLSKIYAIGACAASRNNRQEAFVVGPLAKTPAMVLTMGISSLVK